MCHSQNYAASEEAMICLSKSSFIIFIFRKNALFFPLLGVVQTPKWNFPLFLTLPLEDESFDGKSKKMGTFSQTEKNIH